MKRESTTLGLFNWDLFEGYGIIVGKTVTIHGLFMGKINFVLRKSSSKETLYTSKVENSIAKERIYF